MRCVGKNQCFEGKYCPSYVVIPSRNDHPLHAECGRTQNSIAKPIAPPPDVLSLLDTTTGALRNSGGALPQHIATGVVTLIERLSPGDGLCHGDLHPGNVIMTTDGPRLID